MQRKKIKLKESEMTKIVVALAKKGNKSKKALAEFCQVPQSNVSIWLAGKFLPIKHYDKVHDFLGLKSKVNSTYTTDNSSK